jgi:hypothetical protein
MAGMTGGGGVGGGFGGVEGSAFFGGGGVGYSESLTFGGVTPTVPEVSGSSFFLFEGSSLRSGGLGLSVDLLSQNGGKVTNTLLPLADTSTHFDILSTASAPARARSSALVIPAFVAFSTAFSYALAALFFP